MKLRLAFLSPAEYEALKLADEHYSYREIAEIIGVTPATVSAQMASVRAKTNTRNRYEMVREARALGLLGPEGKNINLDRARSRNIN